MDTFKRSLISAKHRAGEPQGRMWPEGQPLGYINSILIAISRWQTREGVCHRCLEEWPYENIDSMGLCDSCGIAICGEILAGLRGLQLRGEQNSV